MVRDFTAGVQHIGIPTNDMKATADFYRRLGFDLAFETTLRNPNCRVCFFKLDTLCIEAYENGQAPLRGGAVDHIAIDTTDIKAAWDFVRREGF
ncbi:MAG: VOC family protein, partial [Treponema sp.]|nr:VOC family protein [Treponema sp.]